MAVSTEAEARAESRREAAPAAAVVLLVIVVLAVVSLAKDWELLGLSWWIWLLVALPVLLLTIDLALTLSRQGPGSVAEGGHVSSSDCSRSATSRPWRFSSPAS